MFRLHANTYLNRKDLRYVTSPEGGDPQGGGASSETPPEEEAPPAETKPADQDAEPAEEEKPEEEKVEEAPPEDGDPEKRNDFPDLPEWAQSEIRSARREAASFRSQLREAQEALKAAKTPEDIEAATKGLSEKLAATERQLVAERHRLPEELAERLVGDTLEEMEADAKKLARLVRSTPDVETLGGGLTPSESDDEFDPVAAAKAARSRRY